ncbi:hypothetical protein NLG97_g6140 [Lecanicillium saksenae]|uniref:Uncharacterized protein n=1 Tax=Lecanicillium saksenae TaxID=468837 RepID=A0ACC1QUA3_9HYPO|nr:hypothetical protein NLG97_g6140 [Lecanicillium saksenae]
MGIHPIDVMYSENESTMLKELDLDLLMSLPVSIVPTNGTVADDHEWKHLRCFSRPINDHKIVADNNNAARIISRMANLDLEVGALASGTTSRFNSSSTEICTQSSALSTSIIFQAKNVSGLRPYQNQGSVSSRFIDNLCAAVKDPEQAFHTGCYGLIKDYRTVHGRQFAFAPTSLSPTTKPLVLSLLRIWECGQEIPRMSYRVRQKLAVTVAINVIQLYDTPWLPVNFTAQNIMFMANGKGGFYDNPFIWSSSQCDRLEYATQASPEYEPGRNQTLRSLGFLLLELFFGRPLWDDLDPSDPGSKAARAQVLLMQLRTESLNYFSAVSRCLDGELHATPCDDMELRENIYSGVVALLERDLEVL